jgi:hypothetical protein
MEWMGNSIMLPDTSNLILLKSIKIIILIHIIPLFIRDAVFGFIEVNNLGTYLGILSLGRAPRRGDFKYLMEKVKTKLAGWMARHLSLAGSITLTKFVIKCLPIFSMMSMHMQRNVQMKLRSFRGPLFGWSTYLDPS